MKSFTDLEVLVAGNEPIPRSLELLMELAEPALVDSLREALGYRVVVDAMMISQFLNASVGEQLLRRMSNVGS